MGNGGKAAGAWGWQPPPSSEVKNEFGVTPPLPLHAFTVWSGATFRTYSICQMFIFVVLMDKIRIFVMDTQLVTEFFSLCFLEQRGLKVQLSAYGGPRNFVELTRGPHIPKGWTPPVRAVNRTNSTQACNSRIDILYILKF